MFEGLLQGYRAISPEWKKRAPVAGEVFRLYRKLVRREAIPYAEIEPQLLPRRSGSAVAMPANPI